MRVILDTHILLWSVADDDGLTARARQVLLDPANELYVSAASLWEMAIKYALGRGDMPISAAEASELAVEAGFQLLPILPAHAITVGQLVRGQHSDPFDRMLLAQAMAESMRPMTHDQMLVTYGDPVLSV